MALINCPECSKQVSDKAEFCIHCGYPIQKYGNKKLDESISEDKHENIESLLYDVIILDIGISGIDVAIHYGIITGVKYKEAEKMLEKKRNILVVESVLKESADLVRKVMEACGALVEVRPNTTSMKENVIDTKNILFRGEKILHNPLPPYRDPSLPPVCPNCGSTAITAGPLTYRWSSGRTINRCANCGYSWEPR